MIGYNMNWYKIAQQSLMFYPWENPPGETSEKVKPYTSPNTGKFSYKCHSCGKEITEEEIGTWFKNKELKQKYNLPNYNPDLIIQGFTEIANYLRPFYDQYQKSQEGRTESWGHSWEVQVPGLISIINKYPIIIELMNVFGTHNSYYLQKIFSGSEELSGHDLEAVKDLIENPVEKANELIQTSGQTIEIAKEVPLCEECTEGLNRCTSCNEIIKPDGNSYPAVWDDTEKYCENCIESGRANVCSNCLKADSTDDMHYREDEGYICDECYKGQTKEHIEWASDVISNLDIPIGKNYPTSEKSINNVNEFIKRYSNKRGNKNLTEEEWERILYMANKSRMSEASLNYLNNLKDLKGPTSTISDILQDIENNVEAQGYIKERYPGIKNFHDLPFDIEVVENYNNDIPGFTVAITPSDKFFERAEKEKPGITSVWKRMSHTPHHPGYLAYARCAYDGGDNIVINNLQRDADYDNYKARSIAGGTGRDEEARWLDNRTKHWDVFLLDLLKSLGISEDKSVFLTTFDQQKKKWGNLPVHKSKKTYQQVPEQMGMSLEDPDNVYDLVEQGVGNTMYQVANNWYKRIKYAQIWYVESDGSFQDELFKMHKLEYELFMIREKPFSGLPQRKENIIKKVEKELKNAMKNVKGRLIRLYEEWLVNHAILEPEKWAEQRAIELAEAESIEQRFAGAITEYETYAYKKGERIGISFDQSFREILDKISQNIEAFPSLKNLLEVMAQDYKDNVMKVDAYDDLEDFNENYRTNFIDPQQAEQYIDNMTADDMGFDLMEYISSGGWKDFLSFMEENADMEQFLREFYKNMVFPVWYAHWKEKGIDETRENIENIYKELIEPHNLKEESIIINRALGAAHQSGEMLDYLEEEISEKSGDIKNLLDNFTKGTDVPVWDKELKTIGVQV